MNSEGNSYAVTIERVPGFKETRKTFVIQSFDDDQAMATALATTHRYGQFAILIGVKLINHEEAHEPE